MIHEVVIFCFTTFIYLLGIFCKLEYMNYKSTELVE